VEEVNLSLRRIRRGEVVQKGERGFRRGGKMALQIAIHSRLSEKGKRTKKVPLNVYFLFCCSCAYYADHGSNLPLMLPPETFLFCTERERERERVAFCGQ
jgi:hypothetical protein